MVVCYSRNAGLVLDVNLALIMKCGVYRLVLFWNAKLIGSRCSWNANLLRLAFVLKHEAIQACVLMLKQTLRSAYWKQHDHRVWHRVWPSHCLCWSVTSTFEFVVVTFWATEITTRGYLASAGCVMCGRLHDIWSKAFAHFGSQAGQVIRRRNEPVYRISIFKSIYIQTRQLTLRNGCSHLL